MLYLSRSSPLETTSEFFRFTRAGDLLPLFFSACQFGLLLALTLHVYWLRFRDEFGAQFAIRVGEAYSGATDVLMEDFLRASVSIVAMAVIARVGVIIYFVRHPAFAHRGLYRHSMLSSALVIVSGLEGSIFTALAKSNVSYKVFKLVASIYGLAVFDLPSTLLVVVYYFALVDFNQLGVTFGDYLLEDLLRAAAVVSILCVLFKVFMLTLMKATLQDTAEENPFDGPACCGGTGVSGGGAARRRGRRGRGGEDDASEDDLRDSDDENGSMRI